MNLNPFIDLISSVLGLYSFALFVHIILSWLIYFSIVNPYQPLVQRLIYFFNRIFEPVLDKIRQVLPPIAGLDLSPIALFLLIRFAQSAMVAYLYK